MAKIKVPGYKRFSKKEMNQLKTIRYQGFATKSVPRYDWRGGGKDGRRRVQVGYSRVTNYDAYNDGLLGKARDAVGIKNVNSADEIRRIYDYIGGYDQAAAQVSQPPAAPPTPRYNNQTLSTNVKKTTFDTSAYDRQIAKLGKSLSGLQDQLKSNQATYAKNLKNQTTNFNKLLGTQQSNFNKNMAAQTEKYDNNMASLRNSLAETMSNKQQPSVGVKTSGMTQQSAAMGRQGVKGTFGRTGLRIKGIKDNSLNI